MSFSALSFAKKCTGFSLNLWTETEYRFADGHLSYPNVVQYRAEPQRPGMAITGNMSCPTCNITTYLVFRKVRCKVRTNFVVFHSLLKSCHDPVQQEGRSFRNNYLHTRNTPLLKAEGHRNTFLESCH